MTLTSPPLGQDSDIGGLSQPVGHEQIINNVLYASHPQYMQEPWLSNNHSASAFVTQHAPSHIFPLTSPTTQMQHPLSQQWLTNNSPNEQAYGPNVDRHVGSSSPQIWTQRPTMQQTTIPHHSYPHAPSPSQTTYTYPQFQSSQTNTGIDHAQNVRSDANTRKVDNRCRDASR
jgi:hypothetical protein